VRLFYSYFLTCHDIDAGLEAAAGALVIASHLTAREVKDRTVELIQRLRIHVADCVRHLVCDTKNALCGQFGIVLEEASLGIDYLGRKHWGSGKGGHILEECYFVSNSRLPRIGDNDLYRSVHGQFADVIQSGIAL